MLFFSLIFRANQVIILHCIYLPITEQTKLGAHLSSIALRKEPSALRTQWWRVIRIFDHYLNKISEYKSIYVATSEFIQNRGFARKARYYNYLPSDVAVFTVHFKPHDVKIRI